MKREANFQTTFNHWLKNVYKHTGAFELKQTSTALPFSAVVPHQVEALLNAKHGVLVYKIPDAGYQNPFDAFCLASVPAYVVIKYPKSFELISIDVWEQEKKSSHRKSLTYGRAREISTYSIANSK